MDRREVLRVAGGLLAGALGAGAAEPPAGHVMTVRGPIQAGSMGVTLPHEHVLVDFIGAEKVSPSRYRTDDVIAAALPPLRRITSLGVSTFIDCTPAYLGRDPQLLRSLSDRIGLHILTNTGYYGAAAEKYLPAHARAESADRLAERWLREWRSGIGDSEIRPGFIKIGMDRGPLTENQRKLVRAAARVHRESGLTIAAHTGDGAATAEQLKILVEEGVSPSGWIWVHAQSEPDPETHAKAARAGAWVEFDGVGQGSIAVAVHSPALKVADESAIPSS
ncbi:MAG: hypothetical protein U0790_21835 [Isosphaeraceae bacterium]